MYDYLDRYCERIHPQWWTEPLNITSNLAFLIVAIMLWHQYSRNWPRHSLTRWDLQLLILLVFVIGIGSTMWHISAEFWALLADQVPIILFINLYLISCLYRVFQLRIVTILLIFTLYHITNTGLQLLLPDQFLNGSIFYLPTLVFLLIITFTTYVSRTILFKPFLVSAMLFLVALVFRTIDLEICGQFVIGTHFIWHILIAITIFYLMRVLLSLPTSRFK